MIREFIKLRWLLLPIVLATSFVSWAVWRQTHRTATSLSDDPRLTFDTPYQNVRPDVKYVGSGQCASCHPDQTASYRQHPMGRSLAPVAKADTIERFGPESHNPFESSGLQFLVDRRGDKLLHHEIRLDPRTQAKTEFSSSIQYVLGSGTRARAYLIDREGYLFESAITWYSQKGMWDLSPGFAGNPHSDRPITVECLFCHCNQADAMDSAVNHYRPPIFHGAAIGCERCHGPGELHVRRRQGTEPVSEQDNTIVNPGRLPASLREAVCNQCHLQGEMRILHAGRKAFDFRPGLPWELFWSVFVKPTESTSDHRAVGQVEQMVASRCYSGGRLGCISCHDPHAVPEAGARISYYRDRCLRCHSPMSCSRPMVTRAGQNENVDCVSCHMPRLQSSDVAHTAITDHRILRRPESRREDAKVSESPAQLDHALNAFPSDALDRKDPQFSRDLALALTRLAESSTTDRPTRIKLTGDALPLLDAAVKACPDDVPTWQARGYVLWQQNRKEDAQASFETGLRLAPDREITLTYAASLAAEMGKHTDAIALWQRALAVNPWTAGSHFELARMFVLRQEWQKAAEEAKIVKEINPFHLEARKLLIICYQQMGDQSKARSEFAHLLELNPPDQGSLDRWFNQQKR
jgi:tetratricopeptide (TPR) repeat protein